MIEKLKSQKFFLFFLIGSLVTGLSILLVKGSMPILDLKFFYLKEDARNLITEIGGQGRVRYLYICALDFFYMFFYTGFFYSCYSRFFDNRDQLKMLLILPTLVYLADTLETSLILYTILSFPVWHEHLLTLLVLTTPFKYFMFLATLLVLVNGYALKKYLQSNDS